MTLDPVEALGFIAGAVASFASLPQAYKIMRRGEARDVSTSMYLASIAAALLWIGYGALRGSPALLFWNGVWLATSVAILVLKHRVGRRNGAS